MSVERSRGGGVRMCNQACMLLSIFCDCSCSLL